MTGDHLSFDGNCGVRAQPHSAAGSGRSNGVRPSLSSDFHFSCLTLPAGAGTPRDFMAPNTYDEHSCLRRNPEPDIGPATWNTPGIGTNTGNLPGTSHIDVPEPGRCRSGSFTPAGRFFVCVFAVSLFSTRRTLTDGGEHV